MLEIRHLRTLAALAEAGNLSVAARRVHLTQSALSHQLKSLEERYGTTLFERKSHPLQLSPAGQRLLELARSTLAAVDDAERDILRLKGDTAGELRVVLECHTCFDWLMPVMDDFRRRWPEVEVDLVAGFHSDPLQLLRDGKADLVIGSPAGSSRSWISLPLFQFEILVVLPNAHRLRARRYVEAADLAGETLITYPVPEARIDFIRQVLRPAGIRLARRTAELTVAIVQLVASGRGIAALPNWGLKNYVDLEYVIARRIGARGLWSDLHAIASRSLAARPYFSEFASIVQARCAASLDGIKLLQRPVPVAGKPSSTGNPA
jgi:LysR family transcriptional regulator for metE and metH